MRSANKVPEISFFHLRWPPHMPSRFEIRRLSANCSRLSSFYHYSHPITCDDLPSNTLSLTKLTLLPSACIQVRVHALIREICADISSKSHGRIQVQIPFGKNTKLDGSASGLLHSSKFHAFLPQWAKPRVPKVCLACFGVEISHHNHLDIATDRTLRLTWELDHRDLCMYDQIIWYDGSKSKGRCVVLNLEGPQARFLSLPDKPVCYR